MHVYNNVFIKSIINVFSIDVLRIPKDFSEKRDLKFYFTTQVLSTQKD